MIHEIHERLERWAKWLHDYRGRSHRMGYPSQSAEQSALEMRNTALYRKLAETPEPRTFIPSRPKQTRGYIGSTQQRDIEAEATDLAIAKMPKHLQDAVKLKYSNGFCDPVSASQLRVSTATFKNYLNVAHGWLDGYFHRSAPLPRWTPKSA